MRDFELLCEIEDLQNRVSCLETEKMDIMLENGKNKKKLYAKKDKIKKQNIKLKKLQSQLDQQKAMWNELRSFLDEDKLFEYFAESSVDGYKNCLLSIKNKMQELEKGEKDD